jgi:hypothetical protein
MNEQPSTTSRASATCDNCGVSNHAGARFCGGCGQLLADPLTLDRDALFQRPMPVTILAVLHLVLGGLSILLALLVVLTGGGGIGPLFVIVFGGAGVGHIVVGRDLWSLKPAGRTGALIFAGIWMLGIPFGTILGILIMVYLTRGASRVLFSGRQPEDLTAEDLALLHRAAAEGSTAGVVSVIVVAAMLLVAVPVTGIIAAIAVPNFINAVNIGRCKRAAADLRTMAEAVENFRTINGELPAGVTDMVSFQERVSGDPNTPLMDPWNQPYGVEITPSSYRIWSYARDGVPGPDPPDGSFNVDIVIEDGVLVGGPERLFPSGSPVPPAP